MGKKYEEASDLILKGLDSFKDCYSREYYLDFEDRIRNMKKKIQDSMQEGRLLKIGIVGEVKAGKSSFLNALIFDGKDVLPKASTPMTAALTKITYSETPSATIVFYSQRDWERVVSFSREYDSKFDKYYKDYLEKFHHRGIMGINGGKDALTPKTKEEMKRAFDRDTPLKLISCKELTEMFDESSKDLSEYLGQTIELQIDDIDAGLHDYIGAGGQYTAIVKHVELRMNNEILQTIEIVDTPGLNDPIISRGETTKRFLGECDVVFLLSYSGQFLTQEDILFMCETLPKEGIRNIIIVGSKFDSGILDDNKSKDIKTACNSSKAIYDGQARDNINKCLTGGYNVEILNRIRNSLPPSYISSLLFSCARKRKQGVQYSKQEQNIIDQLKNHFSDFEDDAKTLLSLSGILQIKKNKLVPVMDAKQDIIAEKNREILSDNKKFLLELLEDITIQAIQNKGDVERYDKKQLDENLEMLRLELNRMRPKISGIFEIASDEATKILGNLKIVIDEEVNTYIDFDVDPYTVVEHGSYRTGFLGLIRKPYTKEITTHIASVSEVLWNIRNYITRCNRRANEAFEKVIRIDDLEKELKKNVIGAFDLSQKEFDENRILIPIKIVLEKITIPEINIKSEKFEERIVEEFSGALVEGDEIHELRLMETRMLGEISKKIKEEVDKCNREIGEVMTKQSTTFVDRINEELKSNIEKLKNQIDDKENSIKQYNALCNALVEYKKMVSEMEM